MSGGRPDDFLLSIVVPVRDEEACLDALAARLDSALADAAPRLEIVLVDDASRDGSFERIAELAAADRRFRGVRLSRREGSQVAILCGLDHARGDVVVTMDADLQHPPDLVPAMLELWRDGFDVVQAVVRAAKDRSLWRAAVASAFYAVFNALATVRIPPYGPDFRLLDRRCVDAMRALPDRVVFLRGMVQRIGFRQTTLPFDSPPRHAGASRYTLRSLARQALDALFAFAPAPTALPLALASVAFAMAIAGAAVLARTVDAAPLVAAIAGSLALLLLGACLVLLAVLGAYVTRLAHEVRARPRYFVERTVGEGFAPPAPDASARRH